MVKGAVYCSECEQFQTFWYRILEKLDVASILAALPVLTICFVFIYDKLPFSGSDVAVALLECRLDAVVVGASNRGIRPGIVKDATLDQETSDRASSSYRLLPKDGPTLLSPSSFTILTLTVRKRDVGGEDKVSPPPMNSKCTYHVKINIIDFGSSNPLAKARDCTCPGPV
jgi:hypothetical protein